MPTKNHSHRTKGNRLYEGENGFFVSHESDGIALTLGPFEYDHVAKTILRPEEFELYLSSDSDGKAYVVLWGDGWPDDLEPYPRKSLTEMAEQKRKEARFCGSAQKAEHLAELEAIKADLETALAEISRQIVEFSV